MLGKRSNFFFIEEPQVKAEDDTNDRKKEI